MSKLYLSKDQLLASLAKYAVLQSPYPCPDNLEIVIKKFNQMIRRDFADAPLGVKEFVDRASLLNYISPKLALIPEYMQWNERKNGNQAPLQFIDRHHPLADADDDFIDLDALEMNTVLDIEKDQA